MIVPRPKGVRRASNNIQEDASARHPKIDTIAKKNKTVHIAHLYPKQMNVYGDMGNISTLSYRLKARGYAVEYTPVQTLGQLKGAQPDILVGGGGQDSNQGLVQADVIKHRRLLQSLHGEGVVGLMVCGMYQLLGTSLLLTGTDRQEGAGVFAIETIAGEKRLIGNIVVENEYGTLVGFENHSGLTRLDSKATAFASVVKGAGNNGEDGTEGVVSNNMFGTYMHGPLLAKNPRFADELIIRALTRRHGKTELEPLDDFIELQAAKRAEKRPR